MKLKRYTINLTEEEEAEYMKLAELLGLSTMQTLKVCAKLGIERAKALEEPKKSKKKWDRFGTLSLVALVNAWIVLASYINVIKLLSLSHQKVKIKGYPNNKKG